MKNVFLRVGVFLLAISGGSQAVAGPVPYTSAKIYMIQLVGMDTKLSADEIRKNADVVICLRAPASVYFWYSIGWGDNRKHDPNIAKSAKPLIMVMDFYGRTHGDFEGKPETLYCSKDTIYSDESEYITSDDIMKKIMSLIGEKITP